MTSLVKPGSKLLQHYRKANVFAVRQASVSPLEAAALVKMLLHVYKLAVCTIHLTMVHFLSLQQYCTFRRQPQQEAALNCPVVTV